MNKIRFKTAALPAGSSARFWLAMAALAWLALAAWGALTFLASAATGSTTAAAGLGFVGLVGLSIAAAVPAFDRYLPSGLVVPAMGLASGATDVDLAKLATAIVGTLVIIAISAAGALVAFRNREL